MTSQDRVARLFAEANPYPLPGPTEPGEGADGLETSATRSSTMTMPDTIERDRHDDTGHRWGRWVAAAALVAAAGLTILLTGPNSEPSPVGALADPATGTTVPVTTTSEAQFAERVTSFESMVEVYNSGDFEAWRSLLVDNPSLFGARVESDEDWEAQRSWLAANEVWTITGECGPAGNPQRILCPATLANDFMAPAGLRWTIPQLRILFSDDGQVVAIDANHWEIAGDPEDYFEAFDSWLADAHPEVHAAFGPRVDGWGLLPGAQDMPTALEYVDEFLAQSDVYPLSGG